MAEADSREEPPPTPSFGVYQHQPVVLLLAKLWDGNRIGIFLAVLVLLYVPKIIIAGLAGDLTHTFDVRDDLKGIFLESGGLGDRQSIPLFRDYLDMAFSLVLAAHTAHLVAQWRRVDKLPIQLRASELIPQTAISDDDYRSILLRFNRVFNSWIWEIVAAAGAVAGVVLLLENAVSSGVYPQPNMDPDSANAGWWAGRERNAYGHFYVLITYGFFIYLWIRHVIMGIIATTMIAKIGRSAAPEEPWLAHGSPWGRTGEATRELRAGLNDVIVSVILGTVVLYLTALYVTVNDVVLGFLVGYAFLLPVFFVLPTMFLNPPLTRSWTALRDAHRSEWQRRLQAVQRGPTDAIAQRWLRAEAARLELEQVEALPRVVLDWREAIRNGSPFIVPFAGLLLGTA